VELFLHPPPLGTLDSVMFIHLQELKERIERVRVSKNGDFTSEREFSEEMLEIRKAFVTIHGEMVLLKNYSSLNFAGNSLFNLSQLDYGHKMAFLLAFFHN